MCTVYSPFFLAYLGMYFGNFRASFNITTKYKPYRIVLDEFHSKTNLSNARACMGSRAPWTLIDLVRFRNAPFLPKTHQKLCVHTIVFAAFTPVHTKMLEYPRKRTKTLQQSSAHAANGRAHTRPHKCLRCE